MPIVGAPSIGSPDALVTVVEFSDFYCPYCRRANDTVTELLRLYPGKVRVVYHHSLLDPDEGTLAAEASLAAAAQGQFWPFHDRLFAAPAPHDVDGMVRLAIDLGLDVVRFRRDLVGHRQAARLAADRQLADRLDIGGIPVFFVDGRRLEGSLPLGSFVRMIDEEIAIAGQLVAQGVSTAELYPRLLRGDTRSPSELSDRETIYRRGVDPDHIAVAGLGRRSHRRGGEQPLVSIVEFADFDCGYCARVHPLLDAMLNEYGDDLRLSFRHYPLGAYTKLVAEAAEAAEAQGKFWEFHDRVYRLRTTSRSDLVEHARALGLDVAAFEQALDERRYAAAVAADAAEGAGLGVRATPTFFINGRPVVGAPSPDALRDLIDQEMATARQLLKSGVPRSRIYERLVSRHRVPDLETGAAQRVDIGPADYQIAVLMACRQGDAEGARSFFKRVKDPRRRASLRADCAKLGVTLPK